MAKKRINTQRKRGMVILIIFTTLLLFGVIYSVFFTSVPIDRAQDYSSAHEQNRIDENEKQLYTEDGKPFDKRPIE